MRRVVIFRPVSYNLFLGITVKFRWRRKKVNHCVVATLSTLVVAIRMASVHILITDGFYLFSLSIKSESLTGFGTAI